MTPNSILIVEDELISAENVRSQLIGLGYDVPAIIVSGDEAISKAGELRPDLVLVDIKLQGEIDGVIAAKEIRSRFDIPVIYLTAYSDNETLQRVIMTEPFGYIHKPFKVRELHNTIQVAIHKHNLDQKLRNLNDELELQVCKRTEELQQSIEALKSEIIKRQNTEMILQESEKKYRLLAENMVGIVWAMDLQMNITYISPSIERVLGFTVDEVISQRSGNFLNTRALQNAIESLIDMWNGGRNEEDLSYQQSLLTVDIEFTCKDGATIWGESQISYFYDTDDIPIGIMGVIRNMTERKKIEKDLQQRFSELAYLNSFGKKVNSMLLEDVLKVALEDIVRYIDADFGILFLRDGNDLIVQHSFQNYATQFIVEIPVHRVGECLCGLAVRTKETIHSINIHKDSRCTWNECKNNGVQSFIAVLMIDKEGVVLGVLGLGVKSERDFSKQSDFLETLASSIVISIQNGNLYRQVKQQNEFLNTVITSLTHPFYVLDVDDYTIVTANQFAREDGFLEDKTCFALTHNRTTPCDGVEHPCPIREILKTKMPIMVKHLHTDEKGNLRHVQVHGYPIFDEDGNIKQIIEYTMDITERVLAEKMLLQSEKLAAVGKLAASVAHEIKNPMQSILGCLGLAQEAVDEGRDASKYFKVARDSVVRVTDIVNRMRELYRPAEATRTQIDVNLLLENVLDLTKKQFEDQGIDLLWQEKGDLGLIWVVPDHIRQVFLNLILNALDAMPKGGQLLVSTTRTKEPPGVKIRFSDSGKGIASDDLPRIFDSFFTTKERGSGLGLSVSFGLVKDHGGWIDVSSVLGEGSTFIVWLPNSIRSRKTDDRND